ncbi:MAG: DUF3592 domain-containing protein [Deltaproteobacteria bacterium]|nr:DUF3592 domain-containing protein [Deltaproteobacteria bacterium]
MDTIDIAGFGVLIFGIIPIIIGLILYRKKKNKIAVAIRVQGRVTRFKKNDQTVFVDSSGENGTLFREEQNMFQGETVAPVIAYQTSKGESHEVTGVYSSKPSLKLGTPVDVLYMPDHPEKAIIDTFLNKWFVEVLLLGIGCILALCGLLMLFISRLG